MSKSCVALGEVGLDYTVKPVNYRAQEDALKRMAGMASARGLPIMLHCRNSHVTGSSISAYKDAVHILEKLLPPEYPLYFHCFNGAKVDVTYIREKFSKVYFGVSPIILSSRKRHPELLDFFTSCDIKFLLLESDAPYLSTANSSASPWLIWDIAQRLASYRRVPEFDVVRKCAENARRFYKL